MLPELRRKDSVRCGSLDCASVKRPHMFSFFRKFLGLGPPWLPLLTDKVSNFLLVIIFSADDFTNDYMRSLAVVRHTGHVFWPPPTKFRSTCPVDVSFFPFDDQTCTLRLASWLYDGFTVRQSHINHIGFCVLHFTRTSGPFGCSSARSRAPLMESSIPGHF